MKMKKYLALLLAMAMMLGMLAACGSSSEDTTETTTTTEETTAEETADDEDSDGFTWNGEMEVWSILPTTSAEGLVQINDAMGTLMELEGFTYVKKDAQSDPSNQVAFVEDAIAAGNVGCLMIAAMDVNLLEDVVEQAIDAGIAVAMLGAEPSDYTIAGCVYTAYELTGMYAVEAAEDWLENRLAEGGDIPTNADGKYEVACDVYTDIQDGVYRSNAIVGTVDASDTLVRVSTTTSYADGYDTAYNNTQDILSANPDCHIFIAYEPQLAMGMSDAIASYCEINGLDMADYCVIPCYAEDTTFLEMYEEVCADASANAIKGYSNYGDPAQYDDDGNVVKSSAVLTGEHLAEILMGVCGVGDYSWEYGVTYYDTITAVNIYGYSYTWSMGDDNPASEYKITEYIG